MHLPATCVVFDMIIRVSTFTLVIPTLLSQTWPIIDRNFYRAYAGKYERGQGDRKTLLQYVFVDLSFKYMFICNQDEQKKIPN